MAILCLSEDLVDLKRRLGNILVAYKYDGSPVYSRELSAEGAMAALLKNAIKPNLVQTLEGSPALIHGGPFANIAHGCNSVIATKTALALADYCITEAGFGSDLGAEKFFDIKCRTAGLKPDAVVIVATARALKYNGMAAKSELNKPDKDALLRGIVNLGAHIDNMKKFNLPIVVAINRFHTDSQEELDIIRDYCREKNVESAVSEVFAKGGEGGTELAEKVVKATEQPNSFKPLYPLELTIKEKIKTIAKEIYSARDVSFSAKAEKTIKELEEMGFGNLPVCMAKTQYSLSDNPALLGRPEEFVINVRDLSLSSGAGFIVVLTGDIMTLPGLPSTPSAVNIDLDSEGNITGLF